MELNYNGKNIDDFTPDEIFTNFSDVYELTKMYASQKQYGDSNRKLLGNSFQIYKCLFNNQKCSIDDEFAPYFMYTYGNCLQFNNGIKSTSIHSTMTEGPSNGLTLTLYLTPNENFYPNFDGDGLKLFIHNKSFPPRLSDEINLKAGQAYNVAIQKTFSYKTPVPYSECEYLTSFTSTYSNVLKVANKTYRQFECFKLCLQQLVIDNCECFWTRYIPLDKFTQPCLNLTQLYCVYTQQNEFKITEECLKQCPLECSTVTYDVKTSSLDFPSQSFFNFLVNDTSFIDLWENDTSTKFTVANSYLYLISLKIYYPNTQFTLISESPKTAIFDLISQIGGSLGMLLGFSIFHLVELFEIIILVLYTILKAAY
jgi:acid-sensing ion channel, other